MNIAIILLTLIPDIKQLDFFQTLKKTNYDLYCLCDKNNYFPPKDEYPNITFIQIDEKECIKKGYKNANYVIKKTPSAWDKAIYYFCEGEGKNYDYVWFVEYDVFITTSESFEKIDEQYLTSDFLSVRHTLVQEAKKYIQWKQALGKISLPWANSMVCTCRVSRKLLNLVKKFVERIKRLIFIEVLFNTLVLHHKLKIDHPSELRGIVWRKNWELEMLKKGYLYHPIKNISLQNDFRKLLKD